jgi:hypothetical protein
MTPEQFAKAVKVTLGALEDEVKAIVQPKRGEGKEFKANFNRTIEPFIEMKERGAGLERITETLTTAE